MIAWELLVPPYGPVSVMAAAVSFILVTAILALFGSAIRAEVDRIAYRRRLSEQDES
jgi:hypothetical protein